MRDMTEIHFGNSTCQVEGEIVPVAEMNLGQGDSVYFEHHVLLWKDDQVPMTVMPLAGGMVKRSLAGMPSYHQHGARAGQRGLLAGRHRRTGGNALAPRHGAGRARARLRACLAPYLVFLCARYRGCATSSSAGKEPSWTASSPAMSLACCCCTATATSLSAS